MFGLSRSKNELYMGALYALGAFILSSLVLTFIFSMILNMMMDPAPLVLPFSLIAIYISAALSGFLARKWGESILCSFISSALCAVLLILASIFIPGEGFFGGFGTFFAYIALIAASLAGGFLNELFHSKKPKRRKHKRR